MLQSTTVTFSNSLSCVFFQPARQGEWNSWTCNYAAENGYLDVVKWARENGSKWDLDVCTYAALNGHLDVLKWARENGCPEKKLK